MQDKINCAIAGLGRIASLLEDDPLREKPATHAGAIEQSKVCTLAAGADPDKERRQAFQKRWGCKAIYPDAEQMLAAEKIDILHIATPPETHLPILKQAASRNVPVIVCEKPLADSAGAGCEMLDICLEKNITLLVNHERRYAEDYLFVKRCIEAYRYGQLLSMQARVYMGRKRRPGAILYDDGTHMLDIIRFLSGQELELGHVTGNPALPGSTLQIILAADWIPVYLEVGSGRAQIEFELDLSFEEGRIRIGNGILTLEKSASSPWYSGMFSLQEEEAPEITDKGYFAGMLADAVHSFRNKSYQPRSSGEDGQAVLELLDRILGIGS